MNEVTEYLREENNKSLNRIKKRDCKNLTVKSDSKEVVLIAMYGKTQSGWKVVKGPYKNWLFGKWIVKLEKK